MSDERLQNVSLEEFEPQLWTCSNCYCGLCIMSCPAYSQIRNEVVAARGLSQVCLAMLAGELELSDLSDEIAYACTGCRFCESICSLNVPAFIKRTGTRRTRVSGATITEILKSMKVENGYIPEVIKEALDNLARVGNPYGKAKGAKDSWVESSGHKFNGEDTILYVGSMVPYEDRSAGMAEALIEVLEKAGTSFAMLGSEESDSGAFARYMGEEGLFEELVQQNSRIFREKGIKQIICLSPHDYDAFRSYYDLGDIDVRHYTEVLFGLIRGKKIEFKKRLDKVITYQDPCYLGRRYDIYDPPREILSSIPGVQLVEMEPSKEVGYCCGGGGTGLWYHLPRVNMNYTRAEHARKTNARYLAVACPICLQMLDDGVKFKNYDMAVKDIAQIILEAL